MITALLLVVALLAPSQTPDSARAKELEIQWQLLTGQYAQTEKDWNDTVRSYASDPQKRAETLEKHPAKQYWERFDKLAKDGQGHALLWLATHADNVFSDRAEVTRQKQACFRKLIDDCASETWANEISMSLSLQRVWLETKGVQTLLEEFAAKTKNREFAAIALTRIMAILTGVAGQSEGQKQAEEIRDRIVRDYPETETAKKLLARMPPKDPKKDPAQPKPEPVLIGGQAPDFTGKDVDGAEITLAGLRGKVVLLDFWGFWCPHCRAMIPHEKELLAKYAAEPFVILGVNSDEDQARFRAQSKEAGITWRSVFDGGRKGPVAQRYQVQAFPTLFLIDAQGAVRRTWVGEPSDKQLDGEIEAAIRAAKNAPK